MRHFGYNSPLQVGDTMSTGEDLVVGHTKGAQDGTEIKAEEWQASEEYVFRADANDSDRNLDGLIGLGSGEGAGVRGMGGSSPVAAGTQAGVGVHGKGGDVNWVLAWSASPPPEAGIGVIGQGGQQGSLPDPNFLTSFRAPHGPGVVGLAGGV